MARLAAWAALLAVALYVIVLGGAWTGIYTPELRVVTMLISAAILWTWAVVAWRRPAWRPRTTLWPAIVAVLTTLALSTAFSRAQRVSLEYLAYAVVLVGLYLLLVRLFADAFFRPRLIALGAMLFVGLTAMYIGQTVVLWGGWWSIVGRIAVPPLRPYAAGLTYGNPSAALTMIALLAVPALGAFGRPGRWRPLVVGLVALSVAIVALISGSRAGWFAVGLTAMLAVVAWLASAERRLVLIAAARTLVATRRGRWIGGAALLLVVVGAVAVGPPILLRVGSGGETSRLAFSVVAVSLKNSAPLLGTGPGTWTIEHIAYTQPGESTEYIPYAHNLETQTLAELGVVGAVAGVLVVANILWLLRDGMRNGDERRRRWAILAAFGLTYFVLHQLLDFYENLPAALIVAAWPIAYLDATATRGPAAVTNRLHVTSGQSRWIAAAGVASVLATTSWLVALEAPAQQAQAAVRLANDGDWAAADAPARAAAAVDPTMSPYLFTAGLTAAHRGNALAAAAYFQRVAVVDDYPEAWLNLAAEQHLLGSEGAAADALGKAVRLGIQQPSVAFAAGALAFDLGEREVAVNALTAAVSALPSVAADGWWNQDEVHRGLYQEVAQQVLGMGGPDLRWEFELVTGDPNTTTDAAATADPDLAITVTQAWLGDRGARARLDARCAASPLDTHVLFWCARVASRQGDPTAQLHWLEVAAGTPTSALEAGREVVVATGPIVGRALVGAPGYFWGLYTYRRATPWDILVPSLPHLTVE